MTAIPAKPAEVHAMEPEDEELLRKVREAHGIELSEIANAWMDRMYPGSRSIPAHQIGPIGRA